VFVSRQPAELIEFAGEPVYRPVPGTAKLQWVSNTESDAFREGRAGTVYYLVGRWFAARFHRTVDLRHAAAAG
jgi:hypothetical protein